ncbi:MAG: NUDIX hydrolase [Promethearchaeota archaeon]|jgi:ADP-ribose pyrophosphatase YjhB (NUDIX family)
MKSSNLKTYFVVTGVVKHNDKFLILKKAADDWNYPNKWSFCSGYVKEYESAESTCLREIKEETGLDAKIIKTGKILEVIDENNREHPKKWVIAIYLCETNSKDVKLCHENQDFKWIKIEELENYPFVPGLTKDLKSLGLM